MIISFRHYSIEKQSKRTATHMANYFHKRKVLLYFSSLPRPLRLALLLVLFIAHIYIQSINSYYAPAVGNSILGHMEDAVDSEGKREER